MRAPERLTWVVLVVSLVLATSAPLAWALMTPPRDAGQLPVAAVTASPVSVTPGTGTGDTAAPATGDTADAGSSAAAASAEGATREASNSTATGDAAVEAAPRVVARSARIGDLDQAPAAMPRRLRIPALGIAAPIVEVGVKDDGEMEVPEDVGDVGWYRHGPTPGEPGAAVIAGHVDSREQGRGAFFDLRRLDVGARIQIKDSAGDVQRFDVVARRTYDKARLPADKLFSRAGRSQLVLITCGGDFDGSARSYRDNVVIYAQPTSASG